MSYVLHTSDGRKKGIFISFIAAPAPAPKELFGENRTRQTRIHASSKLDR